MGHAAVLVRGPATVPWDVPRDQPEHSLSLEAQRTASSTAWQEDFAVARRRLSEHIMKVTDVLCLSAVTIRGLVHEWLDAEELDARPSLR